MRPAWRLAISTLSGRRSRAALLAATVALSAALIAGVSTAMNSVQASAQGQVRATVGEADARIKPVGSGETFDAGLIDTVRAWPEVQDAAGVAQVAVSMVARVRALAPAEKGGFRPAPRRLMSPAIVNGASEGGAPGYAITEGRYPAAADEVVLEASLATRLSVVGSKANSIFELPPRQGGVRGHLRGAHPALPARVETAGEAEAANKQVGVRIGDEIEVVRSGLAGVNLGTLVRNPGKAAEFAGATGGGSVLSHLTNLFRPPQKLRVVGIAPAPPFGGRPKAYTTLATAAALSDESGRLSLIEIRLKPGVDPERFVEARRAELPEHVVVQTTAKVTASLDKNIQASRLGFLLATAMAFLCAAFIITTAMTTAVSERQRELGMLRCIGAERAHLAWSQLIGGLLVGGAGAAVGVPLGVGLAAVLVHFLQSQIEVHLTVAIWGLGLAGGGAVLSGLIGSALPAWQASRVSPLEALAARAKEPRRVDFVKLLLLGGVLLAVQLSIVTVVTDGQWRFWLYVFAGLPASVAGFFALSVPAMALMTRVFAPLLSRLMGLPAGLLGRTIRATPYRYGFTAGSMMMGLALMVGIWTQGGAIQRDWLGKLVFPDAFIVGLNLRPQSVDLLRRLPYVTEACAITLQPVDTDMFGVRGLQKYRSTFLAFEPGPFFRMVEPTWVQGDQATAVRRLEEGGAVIVAREFMVARGLGLGDTFTCSSNGREHSFEIVGVVTSPGLEVASQFFSVGDDFTEQSMHAVFGSRKDLREKFGVDAVHLVQIAFKPGTDDAAALADINDKLAGAGLLAAGSGRQIKEQISMFVRNGLFAFSCVAVGAMLIAGFGVANLIVAGIAARRYEFGVLRAVGGGRGLIARLILSEAVLVALTAAVLGTWMGLQGTFAVQRIDEKLFGLILHLRPPPLPILAGCAVTLLMTLGATAPAVIGLSRRGVRELLASVRG